MSTTETPLLPLVRAGNDYQCVAGRLDETHICVDKFGDLWDRPGAGPRPGTRCHTETVRRLEADAAAGGCAACAAGGSSHDGSTFCECGSIASGGTRAHCTCSVCW